jgi:glycosyltransferase involved in cell wall biosynthesis
MRIGIDNVSTGLSTSQRTIGGMRHFLTDLVTWLNKVAPQHEYVLFQPDWADPLDWVDSSPVKVWPCRNVPRWRPGRIIYEQAVYPIIINRARLDVFLGTNNVLPLQLKTPSVVVMQSLQYFDFPKIYSRANLIYLRIFATKSLRKADRVVALSNVSRQVILERGRVSPDRVPVIYHGLPSHMSSRFVTSSGEHCESPVCRLVKGRPIILSVSAFYWQKNLFRLVEAFARVKQRCTVPHVLMLVGSDTVRVTRKALQNLAAELGVADSVIFTGFLSDDLIPNLYRKAAVMVMPSLSETFGIPILEAMSLGCPVVTSNVGTMAEIAQDCGVLVDPYSVEAIAAGILKVLEEPLLSAQMAACGRVRSRAFTLETQARAYIQVLEEAANTNHD